MSEHGAFGCAGGAGGVDDGREIVWADGAGLSFDVRRQNGRRLLQDSCHGHAFGAGRGFRGELNGVHEYDLFELRLRQNRQDFVELFLRGEENDAAAGIAKLSQRLLRGERGVERNGDGSEQQAGHVGDGPFGAILAEDGDAVAFANAPVTQSLRDGRDPIMEFVGGDREPISFKPVEQEPVEFAMDDGEENIVEGGEGHCRVKTLLESTVLFCVRFGQC